MELCTESKSGPEAGAAPRRRALAAVVVTAVAAAGGCGNGKLDPDRLRTSCEAFGAADDRSALAYLDGKKLVVLTAAGQRKVVARPACMKGRPKELYVAPGGVAVGAWGNRSAISGDLWGHSGKVTTVECAVDVASGRELPLDVRQAFAWFDGELVVVPEAKLPLGPGNCKVATTPSGVVAACVDREHVTVRRLRGRALEATGPDVRVSGGYARGVKPEELAISPDGRRVAVWDEPTLRIADVESGAVLLERSDLGRVSAVELAPGGGDEVMLVGPPYDGTSQATRRVTIVGLDGRVRYTGSQEGADRVLYWTEPGAFWSTHFCGAERVTLPAR